jgi:hypothetical protein
MGDFRLHCQQNTSMDLLIPEPMTLIEWWSKGMKHSQVLPQSRDGETSRNVQSLSGMHRLGWCIPPGGDAQRARLIDRCPEPIELRLQSSNRTILRNRD